MQTTYTEKLLNSCFKTKDKTKFEHQHDITYQAKFSAENFLDNYIGESARGLIERGKAHGGKDTKSDVLKNEHSIENEHVKITQKDYKIIGSHFGSNRLKRKIDGKLLIKQERTSFNFQDQAVELKLLN